MCGISAALNPASSPSRRSTREPEHSPSSGLAASTAIGSPIAPRHALISWVEFPILGAFLTGERVERRLAAVLAADVAGYSRLTGRDEEHTLANLKSFGTRAGQ
jgi:hypothetical protein